MKIPLTSGGEKDTDKMNDKEAALCEGINNFYALCEKYNVTGYARVVIKEGEALGCVYLPNESDEIRGKEYSKLVTSLAEWIETTSEGKLVVVKATDLENGTGEEFPPQE